MCDDTLQKRVGYLQINLRSICGSSLLRVRGSWSCQSLLWKVVFYLWIWVIVIKSLANFKSESACSRFGRRVMDVLFFNKPFCKKHSSITSLVCLLWKTCFIKAVEKFWVLLNLAFSASAYVQGDWQRVAFWKFLSLKIWFC